ncbi:MAG: DUF2232 domain-containing protein [Magnetococcales bacterium]|nr:DUF2232 domain-containing protein [Magnetococcales bacterium]
MQEGENSNPEPHHTENPPFFLILFRNPLFAGLLATVAMVGSLAGPVFTLFQLFTPLPILLIGVVSGITAAYFAAAVPIAVIFLVSREVLAALSAFMLFFTFPLLSVHLFHRGWGVVHCAAAGFVAGAVVLSLVFLGLLLGNSDVSSLISDETGALKTALMSMVSAKDSGLDALAVIEYQKTVDQFVALIETVFPALSLMSWFLIQMMNLLLMRRVLLRWSVPVPDLNALMAFRVPFQLVWVLIILGLLAFFAEGWGRMVGINLGLFLTIPFFFHGLAVTLQGIRFFRAAKEGFRSVTDSRGIRWMIYFLMGILFFQEFYLLMMCIGLFDNWVDFRNRYFNPDALEKASER